MTVAVFLEDVNEYNGPLMFIPGSHERGVIEARHDLNTTSYPLWVVGSVPGRSFTVQDDCHIGLPFDVERRFGNGR